eukprot:TRINITY_DN26467_c0_g1_i1.p1 TRINITY_DN26467_c0_g1~~TRINITY_DN26467_c0_g1_i1.p1  ORF type:complete len:305 (+),score=35.18 TRINITY_DN26467_c0_g1_i1:49-963(+)
MLWIFFSLYNFIFVVWLYFVRAIFRNPVSFYKKASKLHHKIVIIGDGIVEGQGDWKRLFNTSLGLGSRLEKLVAANKTKHRQFWQVADLSESGSTSYDWAPLESGNKGFTFYERYFGNASSFVYDSEIVIVCIGSEDHKVSQIRHRRLGGMVENPNENNWGNPEKTAENISRLCERLYDLGKIVVLTPLPGSGDNLGSRFRIRKLNQLLRDWVFQFNHQKKSKAKQESNDKKPSGELLLGPDWEKDKLVKQGITSDNLLHLSSNGFDKWSSEFMELLEKPILRVEWKVCEKQLLPHKTNKNKSQ